MPHWKISLKTRLQYKVVAASGEPKPACVGSPVQIFAGEPCGEGTDLELGRVVEHDASSSSHKSNIGVSISWGFNFGVLK